MNLEFHIRFHTPFRVATGTARAGVDSSVDPHSLLPGSSLKGVMRAAANNHLPPGVVDDVFGVPGDAGPWAWTAAEFDDAPIIKERVRIALDAGVAAEGSLLINDEVWATDAHFAVEQLHHLDPQRLGIHLTVLECAARSVHLLGADRRRGLGSVTISRADHTDAGILAARVMELRLAGQ